MYEGENSGIMRDLLDNDVSGRMSSDHQGISNSHGVHSPGSSEHSVGTDEDDLEKEEEDFQKLLTDINNEAIQELKNDDTKAALECLQKGEQMLEFIASDGREIDRNLIIVILYN